MLAARLKRHPTPAIDETIRRFVECDVHLGLSGSVASPRLATDLRAFALKTLDRSLAEAWDNEKGFGHRVGGPRLEGVLLDAPVFAAAALLDAYEATLDPRYFKVAERAAQLAVARYGDPESVASSIALEMLLQWAAWKFAEAHAGFADARSELRCWTGP